MAVRHVSTSGPRQTDAIAPPSTDESSGSMVAAIWPFLLVVLACNLPNSAANVFVGPISSDYGIAAGVIGGMRGFGGGAALLVGFLVAPILDRVPRRWTVCLGLGLVILASLLPLVGHIVALMLSFAALGSAMAIVMPAVQAACGDLFDGPEAGRAASLVNAGQTLSNMLAGPILVLPALLAGWHGAYVGIAVAAGVAIAVAAPRLSGQRPERVARAGYRQAFALVAQAPGAALMLLSSTARYCVIQAWLAFLAATLTDRFEANVGVVAAFWFVGGGSVFVGNVLTGRVLNREVEARRHWWHSPEKVLLASALSMLVTTPLVYVVPSIPLALASTVAFCVGVGTGIAALVSVLMSRYAPLRGAVMGLNAVGQNVGVVIGAALASVGLGLGGYAGLAVTLELMAVLAVGVLVVALRQLHAAPVVGQEPAGTT
jgi:MFS transporter, DHA1 family, inner membrane transport protein